MKIERLSLSRMAASADPAERAEALRLMGRQIEAGDLPGEYLDLARPLVGDVEGDVRREALMVVAASIELDPMAVCQIACEFGDSADEDLRSGIASFLLERLLEIHFDACFRRVKRQIEAGSTLLADTLARCLPFGQAVSRWGEVRALVEWSRKQ